MSSVAVRASDEDRYIILYGIDWETYEAILKALDEYYLRHTYTNGTLEMRSLLYGVAWQDYLAFLDALGEHSLRHTYDEGTLEMMSPRKDHDHDKSLIGRMIETMAFQEVIKIQSVGSTTLTGLQIEKGLQPDESYYIQNEPKVRFKRLYEPGIDPPPDLAIEVEVTRSCVPRLPVFAQLKVPEIWRLTGQRVQFLVRNKTKSKPPYRESKTSVAFPFLESAAITRILQEREVLDEDALVRRFVEYAARQRARYLRSTQPKQSRRKKDDK